MEDEFAEKYRISMKVLSQGNALYEPPFTSELHPGSCGYLNRLGHWQPLFDLEDAASLSSVDGPQITPPDNVFKNEPPKPLGAGPYCAKGTKSKRHEVDVNPNFAATGIPVDCEFWWEFNSDSNFGAVLMCPSKVEKTGYYEDGSWAKWAKKKENARAILNKYSRVKEHGLWLVTTTYATRQALINAWGEESKGVSIGFSLGADGIGHVSPSVEYHSSRSGSSWRQIPAKGSNLDDVVVFFHGVNMEYTRLPFGLASLEEVRGKGETAVEDPDDESTFYRVDVKTVGF